MHLAGKRRYEGCPNYAPSFGLGSTGTVSVPVWPPVEPASPGSDSEGAPLPGPGSIGGGSDDGGVCVVGSVGGVVVGGVVVGGVGVVVVGGVVTGVGATCGAGAWRGD